MVIIELMQSYPRISIAIVSTLVTLFMTLVYKYTTNQTRIAEIKKTQKEYQEKAKELKNHPEKMMEVQKKILELSGEMMKHSLKPMIITMLPMFVLIMWIRNIYASVLSSWIWYYIIFGILTNSLFRKLLKVQ
ncbi:MAG: EMC3/TMCO1 family protein [Candidatus Pacearchaeota archaeon]